MLYEERARGMLNELFVICSELLLEKITLEQFAEKVDRLAKEKRGMKKQVRRN